MNIRNDDIYTNQVHLKRVLAGLATPAFAPAPATVLGVLDPENFPGMGALNEDDRGYLQCPVRDCGKYFPRLSTHLNQAHRGIGGDRTIREALGIPKSRVLVSASIRAVARAAAILRPLTPAQRAGLASGYSRAKNRKHLPNSAVARNFSDTCSAQLLAKIESLATRLGHAPTYGEFIEEYGANMWEAVRRVYGTWNNAKSLCGLSPATKHWHPTRTGRTAVLESLKTYYDATGDLPGSVEVQRRSTTPLVPCYTTILKNLGVSTWQAAMRSAVDYLGITSERYGAPTRRAG